MTDNPVCQAQACPLAGLCSYKYRARSKSQTSYNDYSQICLNNKFQHFVGYQSEEVKGIPFHQIWALAMSPIGMYYRYMRRKWLETYNARWAYIQISEAYNRDTHKYDLKYMFEVGGAPEQPALREEWFPTLEDILADDWVALRR